MEFNPFGIALKLLSLKYSVIPSGRGEKHKAPLVDWAEYQERLPTEKEIQEWQRSLNPPLWGIVTGKISRLVVVDADTEGSREALQTELGEPHVLTPRGGGHWYFTHPGHPVKTTVAIIPDVDIRGDGGFVNIVGERPDGNYRVVVLPEPKNLLPWDKLPELIRQRLDGGKWVARTPVEGSSVIAEGERNAKLASIAGSMRRQGMVQDVIEASLLKVNALQCQPPLSEREVLVIAGSISRYESGPGGGITSNYNEGTDYINTDNKGNQNLDLAKLISDILVENTFATMNDTDEILLYRDGYYQGNGSRYIKAQCQAKVGITPLLTEHKVNEVIGHIARSTYIDRGLFNTNKYVINLSNGLLDVRTLKLSPHTPKFLSTISLPINYDRAVDCPEIKKFVNEVHKRDDIPVIQEVFGYILIPDNTIQKAILFVGQGGEGKSTELNLFRDFVGKDNCSNVSWHKLELNRFALSTLEGKLVNIFADLPSQSLNTTTSFKMLTGGDTIGTEKKFRDQYSFTNFARLIFSTNKPPKIYDDDSYAFWRRWVIIEFPNQIPEDKQDKHILKTLTTDSELSGLLNWALEGLGRVLSKQGYSYQRTVEETTEYYLRAADPVYAFLTDRCEVDSAGYVPKEELYLAFVEYATANSIPILKPNSFARALTNQSVVRIRSTRPIINNVRVTAWEGIKIVESVKDVKDVNDFSSIIPNSAHTQENILNIGKNPGNPDNPDRTAELPDYPTHPCLQCGEEEPMIDEKYFVYKCSKCGRYYPKPGGGE